MAKINECLIKQAILLSLSLSSKKADDAIKTQDQHSNKSNNSRIIRSIKWLINQIIELHPSLNWFTRWLRIVTKSIDRHGVGGVGRRVGWHKVAIPQHLGRAHSFGRIVQLVPKSFGGAISWMLEDCGVREEPLETARNI